MATLEHKLVYLSNKIMAYGIAVGDKEAFDTLVEAVELIQSNKPKKTPVKWNTTTTGHTGCPVCNGLGSVENGIFTNYEPGKMPYQVQKWVKCKACQYYNE